MGHPTLSVIIPTLNEEGALPETLSRVLEADPFEVIVVDGGSRDRTREIAEKEKGVTLIASEKPGRALQMNEGARASSGDVLLFLHADTLLPRGWKEKILEALERNPDSPGGAFLVALSGDKLIYRITGAMINVRTLLFRSFTGDQGIFVRREFFRSAGGFPDVPIMEDLMLSDAMRPHGPAFIREKVVTSARRWEDWGPVRTILIMWHTKLLFRLGASPHDLHIHYRRGKFAPLSLIFSRQKHRQAG